ncbi:MAG: TIR domain-containing protein [Bacteroidota bacterium]
MKYKAFISYSHRDASPLAAHIEEALEGFAKPLLKRRALEVFRDQNDLSASPHLWSDIERALQESEYLIFIASKESSQSKWCIKEVAYWLANKPVSNLLIVLANGSILWDEETEDFDWKATDVIPNCLAKVFQEEPLFVDFTAFEQQQNLQWDHPDFKNKLVVLAATLHGKSVGDMHGTIAQQHRKSIRIRNAIIAALSILVFGLIVLTLYAIQLRDQADQEAQKALRAAYLAKTRELSELDPTRSLRLAEYTYHLAEASESFSRSYADQVIKSYYNKGQFYLINEDTTSDTPFELKHNFNEFSIVNDRDRSLLNVYQGDNLLTVVSYNYGIYFEHKNYGFSPNGQFLLSHGMLAGASYSGSRNALRIQHLRSGRIIDLSAYVISDANKDPYNVLSVFSAAESRMLVADEFNGLVLYDFQEERYASLRILENTKEVKSIALSPDGNFVVAGLKNGLIEVVRLAPESPSIKERRILNGHGLESINRVWVSEDNQYIYGASHSFLRKWRLNYNFSNRYISLSVAEDWQNTSVLKEDDQYNGILHNLISSGETERWDIGLVNVGGKRITTFDLSIDLTNSSKVDRWESPDGYFYATRNGLFNQRNELLISYREDRVDTRWEVPLWVF